jgi:hypothetical protein
MNTTSWIPIVGYIVAPTGALLLAVAAFTPRQRSASYWLRFCLICQLPLALVWSALGIYLLQHVRTPEAASPRMWALALLKSHVAGIAVGSLLLLVCSPEGRQQFRSRPKA